MPFYVCCCFTFKYGDDKNGDSPGCKANESGPDIENDMEDDSLPEGGGELAERLRLLLDRLGVVIACDIRGRDRGITSCKLASLLVAQCFCRFFFFADEPASIMLAPSEEDMD